MQLLPKNVRARAVGRACAGAFCGLSAIAKLSSEERALLQTPKEQRAAAVQGKIKDLEKRIEIPEKELQAALGESEKEGVAAIDRRVERIKKERRPFTTALLANRR
jgi:hypothetical protein